MNGQNWSSGFPFIGWLVPAQPREQQLKILTRIPIKYFLWRARKQEVPGTGPTAGHRPAHEHNFRFLQQMTYYLPSTVDIYYLPVATRYRLLGSAITTVLFFDSFPPK